MKKLFFQSITWIVSNENEMWFSLVSILTYSIVFISLSTQKLSKHLYGHHLDNIYRNNKCGTSSSKRFVWPPREIFYALILSMVPPPQLYPGPSSVLWKWGNSATEIVERDQLHPKRWNIKLYVFFIFLKR